MLPPCGRFVSRMVNIAMVLNALQEASLPSVITTNLSYKSNQTIPSLYIIIIIIIIIITIMPTEQINEPLMEQNILSIITD